MALVGVCLAAGSAAVACTPFGLWLYEDPTFAVAALQLVGEDSAKALEVVMSGCNRNDYDLHTKNVELALDIAGEQLGAASQSVPILLAMRDQTSVPVKFVGWSQHEMGSGERVVPFTLSGTGIIASPIGDRTVRIAQRGTVRLQDAKPVSWTARDSIPCRPGMSVLPNAPGRGVPLPMPDVPPPQPRPDQRVP